MKYKIIFLLFIFFFISHAKLHSQVFIISDSSEIKNIVLDKGWKFHSGDDSLWADTSYDDNKWTQMNSAIEVNDTTEKLFKGIGWFRLWVTLDSSVRKRTLSFLITHKGASEIFIDGQKAEQFGFPSADNKKEIKKWSGRTPVTHTFSESHRHLIAVRYSNSNGFERAEKYSYDNIGFTITLMSVDEIIHNNQLSAKESLGILSVGIFLITLAFVHFLLFVFYRIQKSNLFYSLFALLFGEFFFLIVSAIVTDDCELHEKLLFYCSFLLPSILTALYILINFFFGFSWKRAFKLALIWLPVLLCFYFFQFRNWGFIQISIMVGLTVGSMIKVFIAVIKKKPGAWILGTGMLIFLSAFMVMLIRVMFGHSLFGFNLSSGYSVVNLILEMLACIAVPVSMSIYLASEFAFTSKNLAKKLTEVEELSAHSLAHEQEKKNILESQKEQLEKQVTERTVEIVYQKNLIELKNKDITDSINYAQRIQQAILPPVEDLKNIFPESFILYKPKDIVSGDFYWFAETEKVKIIALADCTGHGVPGAFMSMIGSSLLHQIVMERKIIIPSQILNELNQRIRTSLKQNNNSIENNDGMDMAICCMSKNKDNDITHIQYAGANRPLWVVAPLEEFKNSNPTLFRNKATNKISVFNSSARINKNIDSPKTLIEIKPDKISIGGFTSANNQYSNQPIYLNNNDCLYLFSDGYADQFGGEIGKKFMSKKLKELVLSCYEKTAVEQKLFFNQQFENWKGQHEQIDDVAVIGWKI